MLVRLAWGIWSGAELEARLGLARPRQRRRAPLIQQPFLNGSMGQAPCQAVGATDKTLPLQNRQWSGGRNAGDE